MNQDYLHRSLSADSRGLQTTSLTACSRLGVLHSPSCTCSWRVQPKLLTVLDCSALPVSLPTSLWTLFPPAPFASSQACWALVCETSRMNTGRIRWNGDLRGDSALLEVAVWACWEDNAVWLPLVHRPFRPSFFCFSDDKLPSKSYVKFDFNNYKDY